METALYILVIVESIALIIAAVVVRNLLLQTDALEENLQLYSNKIDSVEGEAIKYHRYYLKLFTETYQELQRIDKRGSFSSDDEVGFAFRVILKAIEDAKDKLGAVEIEEEVDPEKR